MSILWRVLVLCNAVTIVLPPGFCCAGAMQIRHEGTESLPANTDCCCCPITRVDNTQPVPMKVPALPGRDCRCQTNPLALAVGEQKLENALDYLFQCDVEIVRPLLVLHELADGHWEHILLPFRLLYCVWRC